MIIRHARTNDWTDVVRIEQENFSPEEAATPEAIAERLGTVADYIEGPVISERYLTDDLFYKVTPNASQGGYIAVTSLSISKDFKRQGVGTSLIAVFKDLAIAQKRQGISLTCHDYLITYYEMNGFIDEGESKSNHGDSIWYNMVWENPEG